MLPFYKTFPFMDYYKNEDAFAKDLGMIKDMYPHDTAMIQSAVEQRMDELEYEGSFIYDEVPDRQRLLDEDCRQIYLRAKQQVLYLYNSGHTF